jgi:hypothetical protein
MAPKNRFFRKLTWLGSNAAMYILYGKSLGWERLPESPQITFGHIFSDERISLPWFTYPAIAQLLRMNLQGEKLLEYGCGSSTAFFIEQGCLVKSIESNHDWAALVKSKIGARGELRLAAEEEGYVQTAQQLAVINPSIIVVDGSKRKECCSEIKCFLENHRESGDLWMIILDNSDWHGASYSMLSQSTDFIGFDFYGHGPYNEYSWCTTLFLRLDASQLRQRMTTRGPAKPMQNGIKDNYSDLI